MRREEITGEHVHSRHVGSTVAEALPGDAENADEKQGQDYLANGNT